MVQVFELPVHRASAWIFNCYLIEGAGDAVVAVDAGLPLVAKRAMKVVREELGREAESVVAIAATHGHPDHVGGIAPLKEMSSGRALLPARCRSYLAGESPRGFPLLEASLRFMPVWAEQPFELGAMWAFASQGRSVGFSGSDMVVDFPVDGFLDEPDALADLPGWEVIAAPGHTDDSTCLYHRDSATLVSGDAVVTHDGRAWFNPEWVDLPLSKQTEEMLRSLEVRYLLPGHGLPITATDVWATARTSTEPPPAQGFLARCSRRLARWP